MYEALYRKWRPKTFDDVISQEHVTTTLKNQIKNNQTAHAYIFTGPRGTGKTTCARIFAKALNCQNPKDGNPCLECDNCKNANRSPDIVEIDAASNNSVDSVREIREHLNYLPEQSKYRIYIIDEVHMLSNQAFNAFLKSIEEPPAHIKFIFATTEINKVPATILSRCQRFDFRRVKSEDIAARIKYIISEEGMTITDGAADMVARISDGGMRDALSLLDLCSSVSKNIDEKTVTECAGVVDRSYIIDIAKAVIDGDTGLALKKTNELYQGSMDLSNLADELTEEFRNLMLLKLNPPQEDLITCSQEEKENLINISKSIDLAKTMLILRGFEKTSVGLAKAVNKRLEFEMDIVSVITDIENFTNPKQTKSNSEQNSGANSLEISEIMGRIKMLEQKVRTLSEMPRNTSQNVQNEFKPPDPSTVDFGKLRKEDFHTLTSWEEILDRFKRQKPEYAGALGSSSAFINDGVMLVVADNPFFLKLFREKECSTLLSKIVYETLGKKYIIKAKCTAPDDTKTAKEYAKDFIKEANSNGIKTVVNNDSST